MRAALRSGKRSDRHQTTSIRRRRLPRPYPIQAAGPAVLDPYHPL